MIEKWRVVEEAPRYEVSNQGRVRTIATGKMRRFRLTKKGYYTLGLASGTGQIYRRVHRLVAIAFIPKPTEPDRFGAERNQIDHINEVKTDNTVGNLRWCSNTENTDFHLCITKEDRKVAAVKVEIAMKARSAKRELEVAKSKQAKLDAMPYGSKEAMVEATGKSVVVQGVKYNSCGAAAQWIVDQEAKEGNTRNKDTVSKELRRYVAGRRDAWSMYELYMVGS